MHGSWLGHGAGRIKPSWLLCILRIAIFPQHGMIRRDGSGQFHSPRWFCSPVGCWCSRGWGTGAWCCHCPDGGPEVVQLFSLSLMISSSLVRQIWKSIIHSSHSQNPLLPLQAWVLQDCRLSAALRENRLFGERGNCCWRPMTNPQSGSTVACGYIHARYSVCYLGSRKQSWR